MIAMAMANNPSVLIADEPTTALDVTIQAQIVEVIKAAQEHTHAAIILITHDLGLIAELADRVVVMYAGRVVEIGDVYTIFDSPRHPYTIGLMNSLARVDIDKERLEPIPGQPPSLISLPPGCAFHPRCVALAGPGGVPDGDPRARGTDDAAPDHRSACHFSEELAPRSLAGSGRPARTPMSATETAATDDERRRRPPRRTDATSCASTSLVKHFPIKAGFFRHTIGQVRAVDGVDARHPRRARRSASSASPAAARRRSAGRS